MAFYADFHITNKTGQRIEITPLGYGEDGKTLYLLPPMPWKLFGSLNRKVELNPGATKKISYNMDDVQFSYIVIAGEDRVPRFQITDLRSDRECCWGPQKELYVIEEIANLPKATQEMLKVVGRPTGVNRIKIFCLLVAVYFLPPTVFAFIVFIISAVIRCALHYIGTERV